MNVPIRYVLIIVTVLLMALGGLYLYSNNQRDQLLQDHKQDLKDEAERIRLERDSVIKRRDESIDFLKAENEKAIEQSQYWYNQAKKKNINPNYDIDFLTSYRIISESHYQSGE